MTKHNFLCLLEKKAGKTTIFLRDTRNYAYRRISVEYGGVLAEGLAQWYDLCLPTLLKVPGSIPGSAETGIFGNLLSR